MRGVKAKGLRNLARAMTAKVKTTFDTNENGCVTRWLTGYRVTYRLMKKLDQKRRIKTRRTHAVS